MRLGKNSSRSVVSILRPGDLFGELFRPEGTPVEEMAIASGEAEVWSIEGRDFRAQGRLMYNGSLYLHYAGSAAHNRVSSGRSSLGRSSGCGPRARNSREASAGESSRPSAPTRSTRPASAGRTGIAHIADAES